MPLPCSVSRARESTECRRREIVQLDSVDHGSVPELARAVPFADKVASSSAAQTWPRIGLWPRHRDGKTAERFQVIDGGALLPNKEDGDVRARGGDEV